MPIDDQFVITKFLEISDKIADNNSGLSVSLAQLSAKIDGFISTQASHDLRIGAQDAKISALQASVTGLEQSAVKSKSFVGGITLATGVVWTGFLTFFWPFLKNKFGL